MQAFRHFSATRPLTAAFATCLAKGSASDAIAQRHVEKVDKFDYARNIAFSVFSGAYLGIGQHFVYNVAFTRAFGAGTGMLNASKKVIADSTIHVPMVYLPLYYSFKSVALGEGTALDGLARYRGDAYDVLTTYWSAWPAVHLVNFSVMPSELRIHFVAAVSFVWLVYLSYASHKDDERVT